VPALVEAGHESDVEKGALLSGEPHIGHSERRQLLEEAAGISGLHARRKDAEQKLRATEANLTRLSEILSDQEQRAAAVILDFTREISVMLTAAAAVAALGIGLDTAAPAAADTSSVSTPSSDAGATQTVNDMQLQIQMNHGENRKYTAVGNILKTKHDTVKNSIGNIR